MLVKHFVKLDYDATTSNATFVDYDYVGGVFRSRIRNSKYGYSDSDPISIWDGAPRMYVGGEGTRVNNFEIIADVPAPPVNLEVLLIEMVLLIILPNGLVLRNYIYCSV